MAVFCGVCLVLRCVSLHSPVWPGVYSLLIWPLGITVRTTHTQLAFVFLTLCGTLENPSLLNASFILLVIYFTAV